MSTRLSRGEITSRSARRSTAAEWAAPCLLVVTPLVIFLRHQQHPLLAPEVLICIGAFALVGLTLSALTIVFGDYLRVPLIALLIALFFDFRTVSFSETMFLARIAGVSLLVGLLLRNHLSSLVCVLCGTVLITSILFPVSDPSAGTFRRAQRPTHADLPPLVHIILDEQIGVEGIPTALDGGEQAASALKRFFLGRGFTVYGKAYSISWFTRRSIGTAMNFSTDLSTIKRFRVNQKHVVPNRYFDELVRRGYRIHVYQSEHLNFCQDERGAPLETIESCFTYPTVSLSSISESTMSLSEKASLVAGAYSQLSFGLGQLRGRYQSVVNSPLGEWMGLPQWHSPPLLSPLSTMQTLDQLTDDFARIEAGHALFVHLLLPHYPYAYDSECQLRSRPFSWSGRSKRQGKTAKSWAERYELYFDQVECTLKQLAEVFDTMDAAGKLLMPRSSSKATTGPASFKRARRGDTGIG